MKYTNIKKRLHTGDSHFIEVLKHAFWAILLLGGGTIVQFAFDFSLTHSFGAHGAGMFYLCFSVLLSLSLIGRLGIDRAVVRFIPPLLKKEPEKAAGTYRTATQLSLAMTVPLAVLLFLLAPWLARDIFHSAQLTIFLQIFAFALPPLALNYVFSGVLRALKRTTSALSIERLTMYAIGIVAVLTLGQLYGLQGAAIGFVAAIYISTIEGWWYIRRGMPGTKKVIPFNKKLLLITAAPLLFMVFATQMNGQASVLLMGAFRTNAEVGIFNIALKVSMLMTLILTAVNVIAATKVSELYYSKKREELAKLISKISALGTLAGLPLFIVLAIFAPFWLGLFGSAFSAGALALVILAAGQFVNVSVGSTGYVLAMTGHERALAGAVGMSLIINVILGFILIPPFGIAGAAITTAATIVTSNVIMVFLIKHYLDVWQLPFKFLSVWLKKARGATA